MDKQAPLVIAFLSDVALSASIADAVGKLAFRLVVIDSAETFGLATQRERLGEPVSGGQTTNLTRYLTEKLPGLLIFDLQDDAFPWQRWLPVIKTSPATRRIPALVFQQDNEQLAQEALSKGADLVLSKQAFAAQLATQIKKHTKQYDLIAISSACAAPLSALGADGIRLFNEGNYYDAHEELEHAWNEDKTAARNFYKAVLQVAVAYLQIERGNFRGAVKMFLRVRQWLNPLPDVCHGVNIAQLRVDAEAVHQALLAAGADNINAVDQGLFRPIQLIDLN